jgi:hypothetical protein
MHRIYPAITLLFIVSNLFTGCADSGPVSAVPVVKTLPEIITLKVDPSGIPAGNIALLTWEVRGADTVNIDPGIGSVSTTGSLAIAPVYTTTYKITVTNNTGTRERYITLAVDMPDTAGEKVGFDTVTGRNEQIDLTWQDYCYSSYYQVQIARDMDFALVIFDSRAMAPAESTSPAFLFPPGMLEAGRTYYWRVRTIGAATGQWSISPWSEARRIRVNAGYQQRSGYQGIQALSPVNGCNGCPVKPVSFSWTGYPGTTRYRFLLAKDSQLQSIILEAFTTTTAYELTGSLEYSTSYFWQVIAAEPVPSDKSPTFTIFTEDAPQPVKQQVPASTEPPLWAWAVIAVAVVLITVVVFFMAKAGPK